MGLVRGNSDLISRYNLATNGSFGINQRGLFQSDANYNANNAPVSVGAFVSDSWFLHNITTVDSLHCRNYIFAENYPSLFLKGTGKKGQTVSILSKDVSPLNYPMSSLINLTTAVNFHNIKGVAIIPKVASRYRNGANGYVYQNVYPLKSGQSRNEVLVSLNTVGFFDIPAAIGFVLQADGEFEVQIANFRELPGAFINPPDFCPVHLSEDLARCKRYYQSGAAQYNMRANQFASSVAQFALPVQFPIEMAGTPTVSQSFNGLNTNTGLSSSLPVAAIPTPINNSVNQFGFRHYWLLSSSPDAENAMAYGCSGNFTWIASI
jgi:hypothetical protein